MSDQNKQDGTNKQSGFRITTSDGSININVGKTNTGKGGRIVIGDIVGGDRIVTNEGQTDEEQMTVHVEGLEGNEIVFGNIVMGDNIVAGSGDANASGNINITRINGDMIVVNSNEPENDESEPPSFFKRITSQFKKIFSRK